MALDSTSRSLPAAAAVVPLVTGGNGGSLSGLRLEAALVQSERANVGAIDPDVILLDAGNGGNGAFGGNGGTVTGNGTSIPDITGEGIFINSPFNSLQNFNNPLATNNITGKGGEGTKSGGNGGSILNFHPSLFFPDQVGGDITFFGDISYTAGAGGNTVSGAGGNGGSIINSAPLRNAALNDVVQLQAGDGGSGASGGNGGSITNFNVSYQTGTEAATFDSLAGQGGSGFFGNGGNGGSVSGINVQARGGEGLILVGGVGASTTNRVLAGNGGGSASAAGGNGGDLTNISSSSDFGSFAVVAGAGGDGPLLLGWRRRQCASRESQSRRIIGHQRPDRRRSRWKCDRLHSELARFHCASGAKLLRWSCRPGRQAGGSIIGFYLSVVAWPPTSISSGEMAVIPRTMAVLLIRFPSEGGAAPSRILQYLAIWETPRLTSLRRPRWTKMFPSSRTTIC